MLTNFELKRLKPKLDIVKKPENRVHDDELTDSNVSRFVPFELKVGRHVLWDSSNVRTKGFCSGLLRRADSSRPKCACRNSRISARRSNR